MTPRERVFAALNHQQPDRAPRFEVWIDAFVEELGGGDLASAYVRAGQDGVDLMPTVAEGAALPQRDVFWEMNQQTAIRRGPWKLVLHGQLVEGAPPEDDVHLANLDEDLGERINLVERYPELVAELTFAAEVWRASIEERWQRQWLPAVNGTTTHSPA